MSLNYGLNVKKKAPAAPTRRGIFDDGDDDDDEIIGGSENASTAVEEVSGFRSRGASKPVPPPTRKPNPQGPPSRGPPRLGQPDSRQNQSSIRAAEATVKAAEELDASIFDYDSFHDAKATVTEAKKAADRQDAIERKPKYITNLLDAAARRKQDQQVTREKVLQREREAEGDEFADKEKFVTGAYKQQQEENRRLEEEERRGAEEEERRRRRLLLGGGADNAMQAFHRSMLDETERQHRETMELTAKVEREGGAGVGAGGDAPSARRTATSDADLAAEMKARGVNVHVNEEGQITDKRQLLSAGLNVGGPGRGAGGGGVGGAAAADHLKASNRGRGSAFAPSGRGGVGGSGSQQAQRERQTRMLEEQLESRAKRAREEEDAERVRMEKAAKSTKSDKDVSDAKARYLARKAAKERGEG